MSRVSRYGFILAKVYGIMARSFVGKNYHDLFRLKKVTELYDLLYPGQRAETPGQNLPVELEERIVASGIQAMIYVLDSLGEPVPLLVHVLRKLEYQNVKTAVRMVVNGRTEDVRLWDLGAYAGVRWTGQENREKALKASPYAWTLPLLKTMPLVQIENALDRDYYTRCVQLAEALPSKDRPGVLRLIRTEITIANALWALRLRFFFGMDAEKARGFLIPPVRGDSSRQAITRAFEIPPDAVEEWRKWKLGWLLEDQLNESFRAPDPVRAERKAAQVLYTRAHQLFHQRPFTLCPLVAYFTLKEQEVLLLKTAVEALHLSVPEQDVMSIVGAT
ncbi:MAG: V-type ATPase subunit [Spirochaetia bacterium]|jgi:vacuolar-type H+-ATPase subunit C/Vma6